MDPLTEICVALHTAWLESKNRRKLRRPGEFARTHVQIPDAHARLELGQAKSLLTVAKTFFRLRALGEQRNQNHRKGANHGRDQLRAERTLGDRHAHIAKMTYAIDGRAD